MLQSDHEAIGHHDGVVHHHAHGDDQGPQGNPLQVDVPRRHDNERAEDGEYQTTETDDAGHAHAHGERQHDQHDCDGLSEVDHEVPHGPGHQIGLPGDFVQLDARRNHIGELVDAPIHRTAYLHGVHTGRGRQGHTDGELPVKAHQIDRWIDIPPFDRGKVPDANDVSTPHTLGPLNETGTGNGQRGDLFGRAELARGCNAETPILQVDSPGVDDSILDSKGTCNILRGQAQLGELGLRSFDIDALVLDAPEIHASHAWHDGELLADDSRVTVEICIAEAVTGERHQEAEDEPEVVTDPGFAGAGGELVFDVADVLAHVVPHLRQSIRPVLVLDIDLDDGQPGPGVGVDVLHLAHLLELRLYQVGELELHLFRAGAGIRRDDGRRLDGEFRILELSERAVARNSRGDQQKNEEVGDRLLLNRDGGKAHGPSPRFP